MTDPIKNEKGGDTLPNTPDTPKASSAVTEATPAYSKDDVDKMLSKVRSDVKAQVADDITKYKQGLDDAQGTITRLEKELEARDKKCRSLANEWPVSRMKNRNPMSRT